jgi:hypothetical protein
MSKNIPLLLAFISSFICTIASGMLLIKERDELSFNDTSKHEKGYIVILIYAEIFLFLCICYYSIFFLWKRIGQCCNDTYNPTLTCSVYKILFLLSGIAADSYLFYHLIFHKDYINKYIDVASWILVGNIFFIILLNGIYKIYSLCSTHSKKSNAYIEL